MCFEIDSADCAVDSEITLTVTAAAQADIVPFAIDSPVGSGDRVLFIGTNDASQTPDTYEINSIVLTPGGTSLTAVLSVIAGVNAPADTNGAEYLNCPTTTSRVVTFFEDDAHFADITESTGTYTFTYTDSAATTIGTASATQIFSAYCIGTQIFLLQQQALSQAWEVTTAGVLTESLGSFSAVGTGTFQAVTNRGDARVTAIDGSFAIAAPYGGSENTGEEMAYIIATFPLDDI